MEPTLSTAAGSWNGFAPSTDGKRPLDPDEPVLVMIAGTLCPQYAADFANAGAKIVARAHGFPGYLGGCGLTETGAETISFSCWRSSTAAREFAYSAGAHLDGMRTARAQTWHDPTTEVFVRFRPLAAREPVQRARARDVRRRRPEGAARNDKPGKLTERLYRHDRWRRRRPSTYEATLATASRKSSSVSML